MLLPFVAVALGSERPHIVFSLIDDLGRAELGYVRAANNAVTKEVLTPAIDQLVEEGIALDRHYVHKFCSPTRCAIQSGRAPIHVNVINADPSVLNPADPVSVGASVLSPSTHSHSPNPLLQVAESSHDTHGTSSPYKVLPFLTP